MAKINILDISSYMITPPTSGGAQRIVRPFTKLKPEDGIQVDMLFTGYEQAGLDSEKYLEKYPCINRVKCVQPQIDLTDDRAKSERFCRDVWNTMGREIRDVAIEWVTEQQYDIIQIEHSQMAWIAPFLRKASPKSKIVLDIHNAEFRVYEKWLPYAREFEKEEIQQKYEEFRSWEYTAWKWFDAAFTVSPVETRMFREITGCDQVYEVPTGGGIDLEEYEPKDVNREKPYDLLYLGTMEWYPNAQGLMWFIDKVFPKILEKRPKTKLHIVGYGKPEGALVQMAEAHPNIVFWGQQEDDKKFFHGARVFVVPLFIGAGARVKVPTAWACRVPIASTIFGPEGLATDNKENICMTDDPEEYAENVLWLLDDATFSAKITEKAFETVKQRYSIEICVKKLVDAYRKIAHKKENNPYFECLKDYQKDFLDNCERIIKKRWKDSKILEIGCGDGVMLKYIAKQYAPKKIIGIEPLLSGEYGLGDFNRNASEEEGENWEIHNGDALNIQYPSGSFDMVISVATFEHISDLGKCLTEIERVLKPGGIFYTEFGPIWSGIIGHHCKNWVKEVVLKIPPWGHLFMTEKEMFEHISTCCSQEEANEICRMIYHDDWINRMDLPNMKKIFLNSGMRIVELKENELSNRLGWIDGTEIDELNDEIWAQLREKYSKKELRVSSVNLLMQKM